MDLTEKYRGKEFEFHSPFETHPGFEDGDRGAIIRQALPLEVDEEVIDLWFARNLRTGQEACIWGGEAWVNGKPLIEEHAFDDWKPEGR